MYEALPETSGRNEAIADRLAGWFARFRASERIIERVAPDMAEYWNPDTAFGSNVRFPMIAPLKEAMDRGDEILVIAHSLGTMIAYDTLWKFSHMGEYRTDYKDPPIELFITLGSPLGDPTVRRHLRGHGLGIKRRYPANIQRWVNVAAEDDYISHDETVKDDFQELEEAGARIEDEPIYNLAERHGRSNPHHGPGYLVHPFVAGLVADWLA